jgi:hypothetical protein
MISKTIAKSKPLYLCVGAQVVNAAAMPTD